MATQRIVFGEWMPDQPSIAGALTSAKNCVSQAVGYGPMPSPVDFSGSAAENLTSIYATKKPDGVTNLFAAGKTKVYSVNGIGQLTNINSGYTTGADDIVRFTQFGSVVLSVNNSEKMQAFTLGSSTSFADVSADAPIAKFITVVRDFVVVANTLEGTDQKNYRVRWSGINDETAWTASAVNQSDYQDIPDGGRIMGIRGGEFGLVLMERGIHRMSYVGTPFVFQFDNISRGKGCMVSGSIAQLQGLTFFLSDDGFYMCDGQQIVSIGGEKVDRWFLSDVDYMAFNKMSAAVDPIRRLVIWNYQSVGGSMKMIIYNFSTKKWSYSDQGVSYISDASTATVTLEDLDTLSSSIDSLASSLDSILFAGGKFFLGGTRSSKVITFTGESMEAELETGDIEAGGQSLISLARPQVDKGTGSVAISSRQLLSDTVTYGSLANADSDNRISLRSSGKYHRIKFVPSGTQWKSAVAVDIDVIPQGVR